MAILKYLLLCLLIIVTLGAITYYVFPQAFVLLRYKNLRDKFGFTSQSLNETPEPHTIDPKICLQEKKVKGVDYTYQTLKFKSSWVQESLAQDAGTSLSIKFKGGYLVQVLEPDNSLNPKFLFQKLQAELPIKTYSDPELFKRIMAVTENDLTLKTPADQAELNRVLLLMKGTLTQKTSNPIEYTHNNLHYYQQQIDGDNFYQLNVFDNKDRWHAIFIKGEALNQNDIDKIVCGVEVL